MITANNIEFLHLNAHDQQIKLYYEQVANDFELMRLLLPVTLLHKLKKQGYLYWDNIPKNIQYNITLHVFRKQDIIRIDNTDNVEKIFFDRFNDPDLTDHNPVPIADITKDEMISYFVDYNRYTEEIFPSVNPNEYETASLVPNNVFMDTDLSKLNIFELSPENFINNTVRLFISTYQGIIPFLPYWGSRIKEYLHTLSPSIAADMLKYELLTLINTLISKFTSQNITVTLDALDVRVQESDNTKRVVFVVYININGKEYEYHVV